MNYHSTYTKTTYYHDNNPDSPKYGRKIEQETIKGEVDNAFSYYNLCKQIADDVRGADEWDIISASPAERGRFSDFGLGRLAEDVDKLLRREV